ncbi:hypothetical protein [Demetria terragena]|uniref:hypothetical protein n=1 Tax=Demetria terragena TaxID=63959 RepID=UPI00146133CB|nr:hypothetical protein [Demetria terragena]
MHKDRSEVDQERNWSIFFISIALFPLGGVALVLGYSELKDQATSETLKTFGLPLLIGLGVVMHRSKPKD